jgi:hypothetical protein
MAGECFGQLELDHVRASHGIGMKSASTTENLVTLCSTHHREKTEHGRGWRPVLIAYLEDIVSDPYTVDRAKRSGGNVASVTPPEGEDGCVLVVPDLAAKVGKP